MGASVCQFVRGTDVAAVAVLPDISMAYGDTKWKMGAVRPGAREDGEKAKEAMGGGVGWGG